MLILKMPEKEMIRSAVSSMTSAIASAAVIFGAIWLPGCSMTPETKSSAPAATVAAEPVLSANGKSSLESRAAALPAPKTAPKPAPKTASEGRSAADVVSAPSKSFQPYSYPGVREKINDIESGLKPLRSISTSPIRRK